MKFQKVLRGVSNGQMSVDDLVKMIQGLTRETIVVANPGMISAALIIKRWDLSDGCFEIEFSEEALAMIEATHDKRAEVIQTLFDHIASSVH